MSQPNPHRDEPRQDVDRAATSHAVPPPDETAAVTDGPRPHGDGTGRATAAHRAPEPPGTPVDRVPDQPATPAHRAPEAPATAAHRAPEPTPTPGPAGMPASGAPAPHGPGAAGPLAPAGHDAATVTGLGADGAHRTIQLPREDTAEVTTEIPPVPAGGSADGVPLLDLLAPREPGASPYAPGPDEPYRPIAGEYQPVSGSGWDGGYPDVGANTAYGPPAYGRPAQPPAPVAPHAYGATAHGQAPFGQAPFGQHTAHVPGGRHGASPHAGRGARRPRSRDGVAGSRRSARAGILAGAVAGVLLLGVIAVWALTSRSTPGADDDPSGGGGAAPSSAPQTSTVLVADGYQFTQAATRNDTDCVANAYGKVSDFFRETPCRALDRALYTTTVDGRDAVVSVSVVRMPDATGATELQKLADTSGTGNVADLLRAGVTVPGGPSSFSAAGYASERDGSMVIITEADFADSAIDDADTLDRLSKAALQLRP